MGAFPLPPEEVGGRAVGGTGRTTGRLVVMQGAFGERSGLRDERLREPLALRTPLLVTAVVLEGGWVAAFVERSHVPVPTSVLALIGTGLLILDAFAFASTVLTRRGTVGLEPALVRSPDDGIDLDDEDGAQDERRRSVREMSPAQRAGATVARVGRATGGTPAVTLVRVGHSGVELLLDDEATAPLPGFEPLETWRTWRLVEDDLDDDSACDVEIDELGSDVDGTYFAPRHEVGESTTHLVVIADGGEVVVEPYGLRLRPPSPGHGAPDAAAVGAGSRPSSDASPPQVAVTALDADEEDVLDDAWPSDDLRMEDPLDAALEVRKPDLQAAATAPTTPTDDPCEPDRDDWLIPPGAVEVRLLREVPDLVGALVGPASPAAIEFVAYLASHGHRATTPRLRDSLGTVRTRLSRSGKTVWTAAGAARQCLGEERLPRASGNDAYVLADEVTCD